MSRRNRNRFIPYQPRRRQITRTLRRYQLPPLPIPPLLRTPLSFLTYDVYQNPHIPPNHPHYRRNGNWCRSRLRERLQRLGWTLNVQYSMVSRNTPVRNALHQACNLQTCDELSWMPYGMRRLHVSIGVHANSLY